MHAQSHQHFDALLFIGIMFSWVFVFGFVLSDPSIAPLLQRLDKLPSAAHNVLKSVYESMRSPNLPAVAPGSPTLDIPDASSFQRMQLKLKRSQRRGLAGKMIFVLDARMEVPREEYGLIQRYQLGNLVIYDSSARQQHTEALKAHLESTREQPSYRDSAGKQFWGLAKTIYRFGRAGVSATMVGLSLRVTVYSLMRGVHVECKSLNELLGAEEAIVKAGETLRAYLNTAATFDGREEVLEF
jgi:hypothetical protein